MQTCTRKASFLVHVCMSIIMLIQNYHISIAQLNPFYGRKQNILLHSIIFLPSSSMEFLHTKGHSKQVACTSNIMKIVSAHLLVTRLSTDTLRKMYSFIALIAHPVNRVLATFCLCVLVVYPLHVSRTVWSFTRRVHIARVEHSPRLVLVCSSYLVHWVLAGQTQYSSRVLQFVSTHCFRFHQTQARCTRTGVGWNM